MPSRVWAPLPPPPQQPALIHGSPGARAWAPAPAAVSHQVKGLEEYVGVRLFRRQTRGLALTEAGAGALPDVTDGLDAFARALAGLRENEAERPLTVSVAPSFAAKWLVPRLEDFRQHANGTEIRLDTSERVSDFAADDVDIAIRYGPGHYTGVHVERSPSRPSSRSAARCCWNMARRCGNRRTWPAIPSFTSTGRAPA